MQEALWRYCRNPNWQLLYDPYHTEFTSTQAYYVCLFNHTKKSVIEVQGQLFVQSPLRVKSAKAKGKKANYKKKLAEEKHMQTEQITSPES